VSSNNEQYEQYEQYGQEDPEVTLNLPIPAYITDLADIKIASQYFLRRYAISSTGNLIALTGRGKSERAFDVGLPIWPIHIYKEHSGRRWIKLAWRISDMSGYNETITHILDYRVLANSQTCLTSLAAVGYPIYTSNASLISRWIADSTTGQANIIPSTFCATGYDWNPNIGITLWENQMPIIHTVKDKWVVDESPIFGGDSVEQVNTITTLCQRNPIWAYMLGAFLAPISTPDMPEFFDFRPCYMLDGAGNMGKSLLLYFGCSLFGNPKTLKQPAKGTHMSKEYYCSTLARIPAVFDEVTQQDGLKLVELADGRSKPGMRADGVTPRMEYSWDCGIFLSGNHFIDLGHVGSRARLVTIHFPGDYSTLPEMEDAEYQRLVKDFETNYGHIAREYFTTYQKIGGIKVFREEYDRALRDLQEEFTGKDGKCIITSKILHTIAATMAAAELAGHIFDFAYDDRPVLTVDQIRDFLHLDTPETVEETLDPATEVVEAVWSFIATNSNNIQDSLNKQTPIYPMGDTLAKLVRANDGRKMAWLTNDGLVMACKNIPTAGDAANIRMLLSRTPHFYRPVDKDGNPTKRLTSYQRMGKRNGVVNVTGVYLCDDKNIGDEE